MSTEFLLKSGERLVTQAFIGPDGPKTKRLRTLCKPGSFLYQQTPFNQDLIREGQYGCDEQDSTGTYCCDFTVCPDDFFGIHLEKKDVVANKLLQKYCFGRDQNQKYNSYCCDNTYRGIVKPFDKLQCPLTQEMIDTSNPRNFVTAYPCEHRYFMSEEILEYLTHDGVKDKCAVCRKKVNMWYNGDYKSRFPTGDNFEVWVFHNSKDNVNIEMGAYLNGLGTIHYLDGTYEGQVRKGKMEGRGTFTSDTGTTLSGKWVNNYFIRPPVTKLADEDFPF